MRLGYCLSDGTGELPEVGGSGTEEAGSEASLSVPSTVREENSVASLAGLSTAGLGLSYPVIGSL